MRGLVPDANSPGIGNVEDGLTGTSYAAPVVSGALALLMEHFRGTRGNTAIVKRMVDTADRSGRYANLETYGAGHLDIEAALSPVGALNAGQSVRALHRTTLQTPSAFGSVARRAAGIELAAFDEQDFPFWVPLSALISTQSVSRSPIPEFDGSEGAVTPATGLDALKLHWTALGGAGGLGPPDDDGQEWAAGFGATSVSLARRPRNGGWEYGLGFDDGEYLGTRTSGAFGSDLRSAMVWTSRSFEHGLGNGWKLDTMGTLVISLPQYERGSIFEASSSVLSALSIRVGTEYTGLTVEQPLRAETGTGTFHIENGMIENGRRLYDKYHIGLRPGAREVRMTLRHEREAVVGRIAVEVGGAMNAGHIPGERDSRVGFAYRMAW